MREQASKSTDRLTDKPRVAAWSIPGSVGLVAVALLVGSAEPARAGNQGDLILNEISAVGANKFLKGKGAEFVDSYVFVADDEIYIADHDFVDEQGPFRLTTTGTLPTGLSLDTDYYVVNSGLTHSPPGDWFGLSLTPGGAKVDITAAGAGTHTMKLPDEEGDTFFGVVKGNGGNWLELVVVADHLDIRGWTLEWQNSDDPPPADCNAGTLTFEAEDVWSDLRSGTIITVAEELSDDLSYDPYSDDWWINANHEEAAASHTECFKVDNDCWRMRILDDGVPTPTVIQDWVGEQDDPCPSNNLWGGGGDLSSTEVGKLEQDPSAAAATYPPTPAYNDGTSSTFGAPNVWQAGEMVQDFSALRAVISAPVPSLTTKGAAVLGGLILGSVFWLARRRASAV